MKLFSGRRLLSFAGWLCAILAGAGLVAVFVGLHLFVQYERRAAQFDLGEVAIAAQRSAVHDANGELMTYLHGENRFSVKMEQISPWFVQALLAREDSRFWEHNGVDYRGIARAAVANLQAGEIEQGASTITQQLARNVFPNKARSYERKALEAMLARRLEEHFTKQEILTHYANRIYFGSGYHGIEAAARGYFGKPAADLTLAEGAVLAGLIRSPNRLAPSNHRDAALAVRDEVLQRMRELEWITAAQAEEARAQPLLVNREPSLAVKESYALDAIERELKTIVAPERIALGGLKIHTTLDPNLQAAAQESVDRQLAEIEEQDGFPHPPKTHYVRNDGDGPERPTEYLQGAVVAVENSTGAIRAIVGGRDYSHSKYHRAVLSQRQVGSTFKPFIYAAAFDRGLMPGSLVDDSRIEPGSYKEVANWSPGNSDGKYLGLQRADFGLIQSRNTMAVRIGDFVGMRNVRQMANALHLGSTMQDLPVTFLGAFEATLKDITAAYTVFPNRGIYKTPHLISKVEDANGEVLFAVQTEDRKIISPSAAWLTSHALQQVMDSGTAAKAKKLGWKAPAGGKTGTTNDFHDAWFIGYTSSLTCGVWVGLDRPQTIMQKGYGSALALPVWVDFMKQASKGQYSAESLAAGADVRQVKLCARSGKRVTTGCILEKQAYDAALPAASIPAEQCDAHPEPPRAEPLYVGTHPTTTPAPMQAAPAPLPPQPINAPVTAVTQQPQAGYVSSSRPTVVEFNDPPQPQPSQPRYYVERTGTGYRVYHSPPPVTAAAPQRVMRAQPAETRQPTQRVIRRVYRGAIIPDNEYSTRRVRVISADDEEEDDD